MHIKVIMVPLLSRCILQEITIIYGRCHAICKQPRTFTFQPEQILLTRRNKILRESNLTYNDQTEIDVQQPRF